MNYPPLKQLSVVVSLDGISVQSCAASSCLTEAPCLLLEIIPTSAGRGIKSVTANWKGVNCAPLKIILNSSRLFEGIEKMTGEKDLANNVDCYLSTRTGEEIAIYMQEYSNYSLSGILLDAFVAGLACYLVILSLFEQNELLPFSLQLPSSLASGKAVNRNMFHYLTTPLLGISRLDTGVFRQLANFVLTFINLWDGFFDFGPAISLTEETKACIEVISGVSNLAMARAATICHEPSLTKRIREIVRQELSSRPLFLSALSDASSLDRRDNEETN